MILAWASPFKKIIVTENILFNYFRVIVIKWFFSKLNDHFIITMLNYLLNIFYFCKKAH